jgi:cell division protease FtsH
MLFFSAKILTDSNERRVDLNLSYSQFINAVRNDEIVEVNIQGQNISGRNKEGQTFSTYAPYNPMLPQELVNRGVSVSAKPIEQDFSFWQLILPWIPFIIIGLMMFFSTKQLSSGNNRALSFGKSQAKMVTDKKVKVTFNDVAGVDEAKAELQEVVDFLKDPQKFQKLGGKIPKGFLLVGPPGTGKTLLARAIAGEAGVPFFSISGSDFVEVFVGVGASRVRDLFWQAKKNCPCIIFIDEIDAVGRRRGAGFGGGNDEREQTLNQLLVEMDGFEETQTIIVIAATNRPDVLDTALLRPGRFDRRVVVPIPDLQGRENIMRVHLKKVPLSDDVDTSVLARGTPGFSGADLANLVNEAALLSARRGCKAVGMIELEEAKDKVMMGAERRSLVLTDDARRLTAFHEAGHAIVAFYTAGSHPIHKATIIPRGNALGMVIRLPEEDQVAVSYRTIVADITVATGGRVAEELVFGPDHVTVGASSDIEAATSLARRMVMEWGMCEKIGFRSCHEGEPYEKSRFSEATAQVIDEEIRGIIDSCFQKARDLLNKYKQGLYALAGAMLERETLDGNEIRTVLEGGTLPPLPVKVSLHAVDEEKENKDSKASEKTRSRTSKRLSEDDKELSGITKRARGYFKKPAKSDGDGNKYSATTSL